MNHLDVPAAQLRRPRIVTLLTLGVFIFVYGFILMFVGGETARLVAGPQLTLHGLLLVAVAAGLRNAFPRRIWAALLGTSLVLAWWPFLTRFQTAEYDYSQLVYGWEPSIIGLVLQMSLYFMAIIAAKQIGRSFRSHDMQA